MNDNIKVSVITPAFNDGKFILDTINSILMQTHKNLEIIVIDDASFDDTFTKINEFKDPRIKVFRNEMNKGAAFSRNLGILKSTGEYIAFLDGDDVWATDKLEKQLDFMIKNNIGFSCTNYGIIDEEGNKINKYVTAPRRISHKQLLRTSYIGCLTAMYKKNIYPNLKIPDDILKRNDYALWLKLTEKCDCILFGEITAYYRKRNSSISSGSKRKLVKYHVIMFQKLYGFSRFKALLYSFRNVFYYFIRRKFYVKKNGVKK